MSFLLNGSCSAKLLIASYEKHFFYVISKTLGSLNAYGFEAQSTRIRIFLNPQLFLSGFKFFFPFTRSLFKSNSTVHAHWKASSWIYSRETRPTLCAAILVYSSVRDWKRFCYVIGSKLSGFTVYDILSDSLIISCYGFIFFHAGGVDLKNIRIRCQSRRVRLDGSRIHAERKSCVFKNIWIRVNVA